MWYKNHRRRTLLDMHIDDWDPEFLKDFRAEDYFKLLQEADVDTVMIYVQSHMGLCYWPTQSGRMHAAFRMKESQMRHLFELCREAGMKTVVYYSIIYNNWAYKTHPEWRMVNPHGLTSRQMGGRYGLCCPNNEEYREFTRTQIDEIFAYFSPFDGFFYDMTFWPMVCQCESCRKKYKAYSGEDMPQTIDWEDEKWIGFQKLREEWLGEFAQFATGLVKAHDPGCSVEHQFGNSFPDFWRRGVTENIAEASDYIGTDLIGGMETQTFASKAWYCLTSNQPFQYMHNISYENRTEFDTGNQLLRFAMMVYAHHGAMLMIDEISPEGKIDGRFYERMGDMYREVEKYEPYLEKGKLVFDAAVYMNLESKYNPLQKAALTAEEANDRYTPHMKAVIHAVNTLAQGHVAAAVINAGTLKEAVPGKLLIVPDMYEIGREEEDALLAYVKDGGKLYFSGCSLPGILKKELGLQIGGIRKEDGAYVVPVKESGIWGEYDSGHPVYVHAPVPVVEGSTEGQALAEWSLPYNSYSAWKLGMFGENDGSFCVDFTQDREWKAATIHSNPPAYPIKAPSMVKKKTGEGMLFWSAIPIEAYQDEAIEELFLQIALSLIGEEGRSIRIRGPRRAEAVMFHDEEENKSYVTLLNRCDTRECEPVYHIEVEVKGEKLPQRVKNLTNGCDMEFSWKNGWLSFREEEVETGMMYEIVF